jgi:spermidine synthase
MVRGVTTDLSAPQLEGVSRAIARVLRLFSHTPYRLLRHVPVAREVVSHLPVHDHHQWTFDVVVADVYDRLRIPVHHWFTREELEQMLTDDGYADVQVTRRVRNNETFRATGLRR